VTGFRAGLEVVGFPLGIIGVELGMVGGGVANLVGRAEVCDCSLSASNEVVVETNGGVGFVDENTTGTSFFATPGCRIVGFDVGLFNEEPKLLSAMETL